MLFSVPQTPARQGDLTPGTSRKHALLMARESYINRLAKWQRAVKKLPKAVNRPPMPTYESALRSTIISFRRDAKRIALPPAPVDPQDELYELDMKDRWTQDDYARASQLRSTIYSGASA